MQNNVYVRLDCTTSITVASVVELFNSGPKLKISVFVLPITTESVNSVVSAAIIQLITRDSACVYLDQSESILLTAKNVAKIKR